MAADSSSSPLGASNTAARSATLSINAPRFSCSSSRSVSAAMARSTLTNFPSSNSLKPSSCVTRRPSVVAAADTPSGLELTRTKKSASISTRTRSRVISAFSFSRTTRRRCTVISTGVTSWTIGSTRAPPLMTTFSPPRPVRTNDTSLVER